MFNSLFSVHEKKHPWFTVTFDSSSSMVMALANCLHGKGFPGAGTVPESELLATIMNALPATLLKWMYVQGSGKGSIDPDKLDRVKAEEFSKWVTALYPPKKYPSLFIGSSNGAAVHLAAAMGVPWLPQTFLIPVKTPERYHVDDPAPRAEWAKPYADLLIKNNPDLQLNHMAYPNQDRPVLRRTSYFRVKRLVLGEAYETFISENLEKGGTIYITDCRKSWD